MLGFGKKSVHPENAEKQETLLTLSILTVAAILCKYFFTGLNTYFENNFLTYPYFLC